MLAHIEEGVNIFRNLGIIRYLAQALRDDIICHLMMAQERGSANRERILKLCEEGEALCTQMGDDERRNFFVEVKRLSM